MSKEIIEIITIENIDKKNRNYHKDIFNERNDNVKNALFSVSTIAETENGEIINLGDLNEENNQKENNKKENEFHQSKDNDKFSLDSLPIEKSLIGVPDINLNSNHNEHTFGNQNNNQDNNEDDIIKNSQIKTNQKLKSIEPLNNNWQYYYLFQLTDSRNNSVFVSMYKVTYFFPRAFKNKVPNIIKLLTSRTDILNIMTNYCNSTTYPDDKQIRYQSHGEFIELTSDIVNDNQVTLEIKYLTDYNDEIPESKFITLIKNDRETDILKNKIIDNLYKKIDKLESRDSNNENLNEN